MPNLHSDEDGTATEQSQLTYDARIRNLIYTTSILSWIGFAAAILEGAYTAQNVQFSLLLENSYLMLSVQVMWPIILFQSHLLHLDANPLTIYATGLRGSLSSLFLLFILMAERIGRGEELLLTVTWNSLQLFTAFALVIIQALFPRRPELFMPDGTPVDHEGSSSAFSKYTMNWCTAALMLAGKPAPIKDLPALDYGTRSKSQTLLLISAPDATLWAQILAERYFAFAKQWTLMLLRSIVTFGSPYCMMRLLKSLEESNGQVINAWVWLVGIGIFSLAQTVINHHLIWIQWSEMGIPIRAQIIMALFQEALRKKDSGEQRRSQGGRNPDKPEALNLISSDSASLSKFTAVNYIIPASFARFIFAAVFILKLLGWQSTLAGMIVTVLSVPMHTLFIKQQRLAQKNRTAASDKKTKTIAEALHNLRQIKFCAFESQWEQHIGAIRQEEINSLAWSSKTSNIRSVWGVAAPFLVATASICTFAYLRGEVTPSIIFPLIEVLPHLQGTLGFVPVVFQDYFGARSNASRMDEYLRRPEQKRILISSPTGHVSFHHVSIAWPSDESGGNANSTPSQRFTLNDVNLHFPTGELSVISGKTGSGKSLLLNAIIGEVDLLDGSIRAPSSAEGIPVAIVSQTPWLQNATIRDNILFGSVFEKERYQDVIQACVLGPDLAVLPKGDETEIGLRGVKLSGGQRTRLAFARALYSRAEMLVLDDIFSALDAHVSNDIFNALTGKLGEGRTRILVTHHVQLCLPRVKYLVRLQDNAIKYAGIPDSPEEQMDMGESELPLEVELSEKGGHTPSSHKKSTEAKHAPKKSRKLDARADHTLYKRYFAAAGGVMFTALFLTGLVAKQLLTALTTRLLGRINSVRAPKAKPDLEINHLPRTSGDGVQYYLFLYMFSSLLGIAAEFIFNVHMFAGSIRASKTLFCDMTYKVIRMPILWLDTVPIGVLLRAFTVDLKAVDDMVLTELSNFADCVVRLTTIVGVGLYTSRYTSVLTLTFLFWCAQVSRRYIKARTTVKRGDAVPTADILEHFTTCAAGVTTIRAFGAVDREIDTMHQHLDMLSKARRHFWIFNRWLGLQMSFIGILFSTGTGIILLSTSSVIDTSLIGFSLTFSMGFSQAIFKAVNNFGILERAMDATGSVIEYTELETEDQGGDEVLENWPANGRVKVKDLQVAYSAELPLVLKNVSFTVEAGQKLGIVGRTGSGKSSLTLALLRLLEARSGSIHIDGTDISTIKLKDLRSRIAFIPQDPVLFSGTVRTNLDYFNQVSEEKLTTVLRRVNLLASDGDETSGLFTLDTQISASGTNMSQGQRQLLCLARVLIGDYKVMILDEATSAVDNETDALVQEIINTEFKGTLIVVAHRLRTIAAFEKVLVMNNGEVKEFGQPGELLRKKGWFWELVRDSQDEKFLLGAIAE